MTDFAIPILLGLLFSYWGVVRFLIRPNKIRYAGIIVYTILAIGFFVVLAIAAKDSAYFPGDVEATRALQSLRSPWLDQLMILIGLPGTPPQTLILNVFFVLIPLVCRLKSEALTLFIFIPTLGTIGTLIRCGINRPRPSEDLIYFVGELKDRTCSFPSGHTINFVAVLGFMFFIGLTRLAPSWHRNLLLALYALYAILIGVSRIYVGDHWTSDALAGYLLGSIFLIWMIAFHQWVSTRFSLARKPLPILHRRL